MTDFVPLREVARVLWFLEKELNGHQLKVRRSHVIDLCLQNAGVSSHPPRPRDAMHLLVGIGVSDFTGPDFFLPPQYMELAKTAESPYCLNDAQKDVICGALFAHKDIGKRIRDLLSLSVVTEDGSSAISANTISKTDEETMWIAYVLQEIGILNWDGYRFQLNKTRLRHLESSDLASIALSESTLDEILQFKRKVARLAEDFVVEWEKHRLKAQGDDHLTNLVRRVSSENVSLGYDVASVEGGDYGDMDRFIEVKSSSSNNIAFYWSANEMDCARRLGERYWIYFVSRAHVLPSGRPFIHAFKDPISSLGDKLKYVEKTLKVWCDSPGEGISSYLDYGDGWLGFVI